MARSINDIQTEILTARNTAAELSPLEVLTDSEQTILNANSSSKVSIWRRWVWVFSFGQFVLEQYWDAFRIEIEARIAQSRIHTPKWYREKALDFLFGVPLVQDKDYFDNGNATLEQIEASKIIKYAAVSEAEDSSRVILKIAGEVNRVLTDFDDPAQVEAIESYISEIRVAGVEITIINYKADKLFLNLRIKRDPLLISETGMKK